MSGRKEVGTWTVEDLINLFTSSPTGPIREMGEGYEDLAFYLNQGWIVTDESSYSAVPRPRLTSPPSTERLAFKAAFKRGTGGVRHSWLKWWAWNWLRQCGEPAPQYEAWTAHGRADLKAPRLNYLVECGDTSPRKLLKAFEAEACEVFALFPFIYEEEVHLATLFRVTADGRAALELRVKERQARLRELIDLL